MVQIKVQIDFCRARSRALRSKHLFLPQSMQPIPAQDSLASEIHLFSSVHRSRIALCHRFSPEPLGCSISVFLTSFGTLFPQATSKFSASLSRPFGFCSRTGAAIDPWAFGVGTPRSYERLGPLKVAGTSPDDLKVEVQVAPRRHQTIGAPIASERGLRSNLSSEFRAIHDSAPLSTSRPLRRT